MMGDLPGWYRTNVRRSSVYLTVLRCLCLARIGRQGTLWPVSYLARAITKWNKVCGKDGRVLSFNHCTSGYRQCCHVCFKMLTLRETWQIQDQRQEEFCAISEVTRFFQLGGPVRNKLLYLTEVLKQRSFLWTLVCVCIEFLHEACATLQPMFENHKHRAT